MILITGATGLVGGHLIWRLLQENEQVTALKRANSDVGSIKMIFQYYGSNPEEYFQRIFWREGDVENFSSLLSAMEGVEYVYHCAAIVDLGKSSQRLMNVNAGGTKNVVQAALQRKVKKLCFVSSIAALPAGNKLDVIDELTPFGENEITSLYGESKRMGEKAVNEGIAQGLDAVIVNPGVIIGYSKNRTGSGELFKRVKTGMPFYTNGITGYVNVQDVVEAMILLMKSSVRNDRFILVGENKSHKDVLQKIADGYRKFRPIVGMEKSLVYIARVLENLGKLFNFTPVIDSSSARISISQKRYSSQKFLAEFPDFQFSSVDETIKKICEFG